MEVGRVRRQSRRRTPTWLCEPEVPLRLLWPVDDVVRRTVAIWSTEWEGAEVRSVRGMSRQA